MYTVLISGLSSGDVTNTTDMIISNGNPTLPNMLPPLPPAIPNYVIREQDQYMPIANVIRIMRRILPPHAKISDDAKETVQECVSEYISFITGEANERCQREQRKTITAEDLLWAMGKLGFDDYIDPLTLFLSRYRESESDRGGSSIRTAADHADHPILRRGVDYGVPPLPPPPPLLMGHQYYCPSHYNYPHGFYDPSAPAMMGGGYYRDGSTSGSADGSTSGSSVPEYDPFGQFK